MVDTKKNHFVYTLCNELSLNDPDIDVHYRPHFAQCAEDLIVEAMLKAHAFNTNEDFSNFRYLEIGANHPVSTSSTYLLHKYIGMTGVLIEANPKLIPDLARVRQYDQIVNCAVVATDEKKVDLFVANMDELTSTQSEFIENFKHINGEIKEIVEVDARRIRNILDEYFDSHGPTFLSIDIEGADFAILQDFPFSKYRPYIIQVEFNGQLQNKQNRVQANFLEENGYEIVHITDVNMIAKDKSINFVGGLPRAHLCVDSSDTSNRLLLDGSFPAAEFEEKFQKYDFFSVDIFDTLLFRQCPSPIDVFRFIELRPEVQALTSFFQERRMAAEAKARENAHRIGNEDVSLAEIYENFRLLANCTHAQAESIRKLELETETDLLHITSFGTWLMDFAKKNQKRVVITSDMYLPETFLKHVLALNGINEYEALLVSNEIGRTKHTGSLYEDVIEHFGVSSNKILHVGDNEHADIKMAEQAGLATHLVLASKDLVIRSKKQKHQSKILNAVSPIYQIFSANYLETYFPNQKTLNFKQMTDDEYMTAFGQVMVAPLFISFAIWMKNEMKRNGIRRVAFLARDGQFPKKIFDLLWPNELDTEYVAASRRILTLPYTRLDSETIKGMFEATLDNCNSASEFFEKIGCSNDLAHVLSERNLGHPKEEFTKKSRKAFLNILGEMSAEIFEALQEEKNVTSRYINEKIPTRDKIALFDVGWRGSLQNAISKIVENSGNLTGFYLGTGWQAHEILSQNNLNCASYLTEYGLPHFKLPWVADFRDFLEFLCSADHGSVLGIEEDENGQFVWKTAEISVSEKENFKYSQKIQDAALEAITRITTVMSVAALNDYVSKNDEYDFRLFLQKPHKNDAWRFRKIRIFAGIGDNEGVSLTQIGEPRTHYANLKKSCWRAAYAAHLRKLPYLWVRFILRKRKKIRI